MTGRWCTPRPSGGGLCGDPAPSGCEGPAAWQPLRPPTGSGREPPSPPEDRPGGVEGGVGLPPAVAGRDGDVPDEDDLRAGGVQPEGRAAGDRGGGPVPCVEHYDPSGDALDRSGGVRRLAKIIYPIVCLEPLGNPGFLSHRRIGYCGEPPKSDG